MDQKEIRSYLAFTLGALDVSLLHIDECRDLLKMFELMSNTVRAQLAILLSGRMEGRR